MTEHYYSETPKCKKIEFKVSETISRIPLEFVSCSGIYSSRKLDAGSLALLEFAQLNEKNKILDLGCGYGFVGIFLAKKYPLSEVHMADINARAVEYAKKNIKLNKITAKILQSNGFEKIKTKDFDAILFNPPVQAGLKICYRLIAESFEHLKIGGTFQVVLRPREGGKSIIKKIQAIFGNAELLGKKDIFEVYSAIKKSETPDSNYDKKMSEKNKNFSLV